MRWVKYTLIHWIHCKAKIKIEQLGSVMSDLLKKLKTLITPLVKHIEAIEEHNETLKNALNDLLEEEDVKLIPGYQLLKNTYQSYLNHDELPSLVNDKTDPLLGYDPIHAPPNVRRKKKSTAITPSLTETKSKPRPKIQPQPKLKPQPGPQRKSNFSSSMPDLDECMLGETVKKPQIHNIQNIQNNQTEETDEIEIVTDKNIGIYFAEIQGKQYYLYDSYLYDTTTLIRAGQLTSAGFKIGQKMVKFTTKPVGLESESISDDFPDFYPDLEDKNIYKIIKLDKDTSVVQAVGSIENGECALW